MGNTAEKPVDNHKEVETTNVGLLNISKTSETLMGVGEIITTIAIAFLLAFLLKWCCKCYRRARMAQQQELEMIIRRNTAGTSTKAPPQQQQPQEMMSVVMFQQLGEQLHFEITNIWISL